MTKFQEQFLKWLSTLISQSIHQYRSCIAKWIETCHFVSDTARLSLDFLSENQMFVNLGTSCTHQQSCSHPKWWSRKYESVRRIKTCACYCVIHIWLHIKSDLKQCVLICAIVQQAMFGICRCCTKSKNLRQCVFVVANQSQIDSMYFTPPKYILVRSFLYENVYCF